MTFDGALEHKDSWGLSSIIQPGDANARPLERALPIDEF
jgi:hypothetical protein